MTNVVPNQIHKDVIAGIAVTTIVSMAALYLGMLGAFVGLFIPLPILFYRSKLGRSSGLFILVSVTLILTFVVGSNYVGTAVFFFEMGLVGLILPEVFEMNLSVEKTVGITAGAVITTGAVMLGLYSLYSTTSPWAAASVYLGKSVKLALAMYREMEVSEEKIDMLARSLEGIKYLILRISPAILIVATIFVVWSNLLLARFLLGTKKLFFPDFGRLNQWKSPEHLVWGAIASGVLLLFDHPVLKLLGINSLIVMMMIYFFQGIGIVSFYFEKKRFPKALRVLLYGLIALQQLLLVMVIGIGFFDMWIDFRRIRKVED